MSTDRDEFEAVVRELWAPVHRFAYRMLGNGHDAEDATQQTFLQAFRARRSLLRRTSIRTWVFRIAANTTLKMLWRRRPTLSHDEPAASDDPPELALERAEEGEWVQRALDALPPAHRTVLVLFCIEELSHREIAELLQCPEGTVWSRLHHAKRALESRLSQLRGGPRA